MLPLFWGLCAVCCKSLKKDEVIEGIVGLVVILMVEHSPVRQRPVSPLPDHPVQQVAASVPVVTFTLPRFTTALVDAIPPLAVPVDPGRRPGDERRLFHGRSVSPGLTNCACFQPSSVQTR
jgi:hypothetical protein